MYTSQDAAVPSGRLTSSFPAGPVVDKAKEQHLKTSNELSNLAASRQTPTNPAATGQPLTHYHSFFSELLSWNNPRTYIPQSPPGLPSLRLSDTRGTAGPRR